VRIGHLIYKHFRYCRLKVGTVSKICARNQHKKTKIMALTRMREVIHILCNRVELELVEYFKY